MQMPPRQIPPVQPEQKITLTHPPFTLSPGGLKSSGPRPTTRDPNNPEPPHKCLTAPAALQALRPKLSKPRNPRTRLLRVSARSPPKTNPKTELLAIIALRDHLQPERDSC